ncbi:MAG: SDR family NAD(P)-dependent oxidoreductase, partial [Verrucomicrobia bacterium]|nr:SDR family NAD(P)-dependent oxidoreductase [Verrucomicrobiota bacterium]
MSRPVILITGASRGLGRGVALSMAPEGYDLAIHYASNSQAAEETVAACKSVAKSKDQRFIAVPAQLASSDDRASLMTRVLEGFGRLDALINNAGIAPRERADLPDAKEDVFDEVISVNLKGPYFLSQLAARHWLA